MCVQAKGITSTGPASAETTCPPEGAGRGALPGSPAAPLSSATRISLLNKDVRSKGSLSGDTLSKGLLSKGSSSKGPLSRGSKGIPASSVRGFQSRLIDIIPRRWGGANTLPYAKGAAKDTAASAKLLY